MERRTNYLLKQFTLALLSVELLRLGKVRRLIPLLDDPSHQRGVNSIGISYTTLAQTVLGTPEKCSRNLKEMILYSLTAILGDIYEVVVDYAEKSGQFHALRSSDRAFFNFIRVLRNALKHDRVYQIKKSDLPAEWIRTLPDGTHKTYSFDLSWNGRPVQLGDFGNLRGALDLFEAVRRYANQTLQ